MPLLSKRGIILKRKAVNTGQLWTPIEVSSLNEWSVSNHTSLIQKIPTRERCCVSVSLNVCVFIWFDVSLFQISFGSFAAVQSLNSLNDQIAQFVVTRPCNLPDEDEAFIPGERDTLRKSMTLMRHLLMDAQVQPSPSQLGHIVGHSVHACPSGQICRF